MDQLYTWGWPQWVALIAIAGKVLMAIGEVFASVDEAHDRPAASFSVALLWTVILASGGFWS